jgi:hypothetical protein
MASPICRTFRTLPLPVSNFAESDKACPTCSPRFEDCARPLLGQCSRRAKLRSFNRASLNPPVTIFVTLNTL